MSLTVFKEVRPLTGAAQRLAVDLGRVWAPGSTDYRKRAHDGPGGARPNAWSICLT